jgi:asparagine synthase (glutamine-hydrolysing)
VVARRDKAAFNCSRFGPVSREFARTWDGRGVDEGLVDPEALRAAWLSEVPPPATALLLQQAWLTTSR